MKNLYSITDKAGRHLCYQIANSDNEAVSFARMYVRGAVKAKFVREA